jgi:hypothetical protein
MEYAVELGSGAMLHMPDFIKIGSGIQKLIGVDTPTHRQDGDRIRLFSYFQNKGKFISVLNYVIKKLAVKICGGVAPSFLTLESDGSELSASRLYCFTLDYGALSIHWIGGWVGPRAGLDAVEKRRIPYPRCPA